ncbi:hypothetical protein NliqN6_1259 [Naganishia liquefaciens]|uniref:Uncharacterized protein n=1 Tax=Naganishia liquefaciens TaxID=104408 RepID=A0A8H3TPI4_9TREE|nr:hypothetical protein NliqN6_1259 [Naganishia liquefaciens]
MLTLSTRRTATSTAPTLHRTVLHHARPPRRPHYPSPLTPLTVKPTAGTSRPQPSLKDTPPPPASTLEDSSVRGLTFHYAPPPTAPSYTSGAVPDLLRWTRGAGDVRASVQAGAPLKKSRKVREAAEGMESLKQLTGDVVQEIQRLRAEDPSKWTRKALAERFSIPASQSHHLARLAPTPKSQRERLEADLQVARNGWTWRKRFARDAREVRKEFW